MRLDDEQESSNFEIQQGGALRTLQARREVLLSAGALQSPQILMLSGIGPGPELQRHGIAVAHALPGVGQHLHDHVDVVQVVNAPQLKDLFGLSLAGLVRAVRGIAEWRNFRTGMLPTNFAEAGGFIKSRPDEALLPGFKKLELRGAGGVKSGQDLQERHCFVQGLPGGDLKLAANWLSHGYQSTIAWIADLVGHIIFEARLDQAMEPKTMEGLVLIDEIDLYLHPRWQMTLIRALREIGRAHV